MKSGMIAAESIFPLLTLSEKRECVNFAENIKKKAGYGKSFHAPEISAQQ